MKRLLFPIVVFLCIAVVFFARQMQPRFMRYNADNGLSQATVMDIKQDNDGFLWIATADGLNRFDGYDFTVYRGDVLSKSGLNSSTVYRIFKDSSGDLWLSTSAGISKYNAVTGTFSQVLLSETNNNESGVVYVIAENPVTRTLFIYFASGKVYGIDHETFRITDSLFLPGEKPSSVSYYFGENPAEFSLKTDVAFFKFDAMSGKFAQMEYDIVPGDSLRNWNACFGNNDTLLFQKQRGDTIFMIPLPGAKREPIITDRNTLSELVSSGWNFSQSRWWMNDRLQGLFEIDIKRKTLRNVAWSEKGEPASLSFNYTTCVFKDHSSTWWIGTNGGGLNKSVFTESPFVHFRDHEPDAELTKGLYADSNFVYAGVYGKGVIIRDHEGNTVHTFQSGEYFNREGTGHSVRTIAALDSVNLLMLGEYAAFGVYNRKTRTFQSLRESLLQSTGNEMHIFEGYEIIFSPAGRIFVGKNSSLAEVVLGRDGKYTCLPYCTTGLRGITGHAWIDDNHVLLGSTSGLAILDINAKTVITPVEHKKYFVKNILRERDRYWVATTSGLMLMDSEMKLIKEFTREDGLPNTFVYGLMQDIGGKIWISHNSGLSRIDTADLSFTNYTVQDGLQANEFNTGAFCKGPGDLLYFGGVNGLNAIHSSRINEYQSAPLNRITAIYLLDEPINTDTVAWRKKLLQLDYEQNTVSFEFAGLDYHQPEKNRYKYRMTGIDNGWISSETRRFARYSRLAPGEYTFEVISCNSAGVWNETPARISISIAPPFWSTWWFITLEIVCAIGFVVFAAVQIQKFRFRKRVRELALREKVQEERARISRDLHDNIGSSVTYMITNLDWVTRDNSLADPDILKPALGKIKDTARLLMSQLRESIWAMNKPEIGTGELIDKLQMYIRKVLPSGTVQNIETDFSVEEEYELNSADALHVYRIIQEAIQNVIKHSGADTIRISLESSANYKFRAVIEDNGNGILKGPAEGYGMANMKHRAHEAGAQLEIVSAAGVTITLTLK